MKLIDLHINGIKNYIYTTGKDSLDSEDRQELNRLLTLLEAASQNDPPQIADRLLQKDKFIDAVMATYFQGRTGMPKMKEIREQLERVYETGQLSGINQERRKEYNVAVVIRGGTFNELWSDRPGINIHKFDVDEHAEDPVLYQQEEAEFASTFNPNEILKSLESKFE